MGTVNLVEQSLVNGVFFAIDGWVQLSLRLRPANPRDYSNPPPSLIFIRVTAVVNGMEVFASTPLMSYIPTNQSDSPGEGCRNISHSTLLVNSCHLVHETQIKLSLTQILRLTSDVWRDPKHLSTAIPTQEQVCASDHHKGKQYLHWHLNVLYKNYALFIVKQVLEYIVQLWSIVCTYKCVCIHDTAIICTFIWFVIQCSTLLCVLYPCSI